MTSRKSNRSTVTSHTALHMEWDRISCPICMEQPHNAVLLKCSSYKNGCRCYICNTSHRHSNCLDRFRKMNGDSKVRASHSTYSVLSNSNIRTVQPRAHYSIISRHSRSPIFGRPDDTEGFYHSSVNSGQSPGGRVGSESEVANYQESTNSTSVGQGSIVTGACHDVTQNSAEMKCPLCRGTVSGWIPAEEVRQYLDKKFRTCSDDSCKFVGTYEQLREHARTAHLFTKPAHVELSRKRTWDRLQREQEFGDVVSAIRSQIPGAVIVGDYVIETRDAMSPDIDSDDEGSEEWSPVRDLVELPDNRFGSPFSNETLGSPSIWPDERNGLTRVVPQNNRGSLRRSFSDRRSFRSDWLGVRRPSTQSLLRQGFSTRYSGHGSRYHGFHHTLLDGSYAGNRNAGSSRNLSDPSWGPSRRQRLRYTHRSQY